jgi:hypothetical protein
VMAFDAVSCDSLVVFRGVTGDGTDDPNGDDGCGATVLGPA